MSKLIEENGVSVCFPDDKYFEFSTCAAYQKLKGRGVKETDVGWCDVEKNILWLVELKAFHNPVNIKHDQQDLGSMEIVDKWITELVNKSIHAVSMVLTNRSNTQSCLPSIPNDDTVIQIVHLLKVIPGQDSYLNPMQDKLRCILEPYLAIFNIKAVSIISYDYAVAQRILNWIV